MKFSIKDFLSKCEQIRKFFLHWLPKGTNAYSLLIFFCSFTTGQIFKKYKSDLTNNSQYFCTDYI